MTTEQRHNNMSAIHGKDTKPEMLVRRYLWHHGFRFIVNVKSLPGKPDVVLRGRYKVCIFVNGCFWHGHDGCKYYSIPKTNRMFWVAKVQRNKERDMNVIKQLRITGWHCITIWECELRKDKCEETLQRLEHTIRLLAAAPTPPKEYTIIDEDQYWMVAEDFESYYETNTFLEKHTQQSKEEISNIKN